MQPETLSILCEKAQVLITVSQHNCMTLWDIVSGCKIWQVDLHFRAEGLSVNENLAAVLVHGNVDIVIVCIAKRQVVHRSHTNNEIFHADFLGGSSLGIVVTLVTEVLVYWSIRFEKQFVFPHDMDKHFPLISKDGKFIVAFRGDNYICAWDTDTGHMLWEKQYYGFGLVTLINQDKYISFCNNDNSVTLLELASGTEVFHQNLGNNIINICPILSQKY